MPGRGFVHARCARDRADSAGSAAVAGLILVDTSAWVEFDRATGSPSDVRLIELIGQTAEIAVTEPVMMEVASGARTTQREWQLCRLLARFQLMPFDSIVDFDRAVHVYRTCRAVAVPTRGLIA